MKCSDKTILTDAARFAMFFRLLATKAREKYDMIS
jgi:hypothetical protein